MGWGELGGGEVGVGWRALRGSLNRTYLGFKQVFLETL